MNAHDTMACSPAGLISSTDRTLCLANAKVRPGFDSQSSLNFFQVIFFSNTLVVHSTPMIMFTFLDNLIRKTDIRCRQA